MNDKTVAAMKPEAPQPHDWQKCPKNARGHECMEANAHTTCKCAWCGAEYQNPKLAAPSESVAPDLELVAERWKGDQWRDERPDLSLDYANKLETLVQEIVAISMCGINQPLWETRQKVWRIINDFTKAYASSVTAHKDAEVTRLTAENERLKRELADREAEGERLRKALLEIISEADQSNGGKGPELPIVLHLRTLAVAATRPAHLA
jgi:hypothetical protein